MTKKDSILYFLKFLRFVIVMQITELVAVLFFFQTIQVELLSFVTLIVE